MADSGPRWGVERECRKAYHRGLHRALPNRPRATKAPAGALLRCGGAGQRDFSGISWSDPGTKLASSRLSNWSGLQERAMASHIVLTAHPRGPRARPVPAIQRDDHRPDLTNTVPVAAIGPHSQWADPSKIVSLDPWGHRVAEACAEQMAAGYFASTAVPTAEQLAVVRGRELHA